MFGALLPIFYNIKIVVQGFLIALEKTQLKSSYISLQNFCFYHDFAFVSILNSSNTGIAPYLPVI